MAPAPKAVPDRMYGLAEAKQHTTDKDCWLIVHGKVYDVTEFLEEHPGGYDIILTSTGKDATQDFEEIGHSNSAREILEKYVIGKYEGGDSAPADSKPAAAAAGGTAAPSAVQRSISVMLPLLLIVAAILLNMYMGAKKEA